MDTGSILKINPQTFQKYAKMMLFAAAIKHKPASNKSSEIIRKIIKEQRSNNNEDFPTERQQEVRNLVYQIWRFSIKLQYINYSNAVLAHIYRKK